MSIVQARTRIFQRPQSWRLDSIRRIPTGWQIVITADGETVIASVGIGNLAGRFSRLPCSPGTTSGCADTTLQAGAVP